MIERERLPNVVELTIGSSKFFFQIGKPRFLGFSSFYIKSAFNLDVLANSSQCVSLDILM